MRTYTMRQTDSDKQPVARVRISVLPLVPRFLLLTALVGLIILTGYIAPEYIFVVVIVFLVVAVIMAVGILERFANHMMVHSIRVVNGKIVERSLFGRMNSIPYDSVRWSFNGRLMTRWFSRMFTYGSVLTIREKGKDREIRLDRTYRPRAFLDAIDRCGIRAPRAFLEIRDQYGHMVDRLPVYNGLFRIGNNPERNPDILVAVPQTVEMHVRVEPLGDDRYAVINEAPPLLLKPYHYAGEFSIGDYTFEIIPLTRICAE